MTHWVDALYKTESDSFTMRTVLPPTNALGLHYSDLCGRYALNGECTPIEECAFLPSIAL